MNRPTVAYGTFCCPKDLTRALDNLHAHRDSHNFAFDENFLVYQRCRPDGRRPMEFECLQIRDSDGSEEYADILNSFGIQWPNPVLDELTHGWSAPHFWAHHMVNHLHVLQHANSDYIVFADADCHMKDQPAGQSWIDRGIEILESDPKAFLVSPCDGGPERYESIMSQQMFLINRKKFLEMEFIPWDGKFIEGGPFQEYYGLLEGWIARYMAKQNLFRYVLGPTFRYWHKEWH